MKEFVYFYHMAQGNLLTKTHNAKKKRVDGFIFNVIYFVYLYLKNITQNF